MKITKLFILVVLICSAHTAFAQKTSDWKLFTSNYIFADDAFQEITKVTQKGKLNTIYDVVTAPNGDIYLAAGGGLFLYSNKVLKEITVSKNPFATAFALEFDSKGNMWIGVSGKLIMVRPDGTFENHTKETHPGLEIGEVREIVIDKNDRVWVTGHKFMNTKAGAGISVWDGTSWTNYQEGLDKAYVEDLTIDANGNIWAVMGREDQGVVMYDGTTWHQFGRDNSSLKTPIVRAIAAGVDGTVYFGTEQGLTTYKDGKWENVSLTQIFASKFLTRLAGSDQPSIVSLAVDKNGVIWIGTKKEGVIRLNGESKVMITMENSPLTSNSVRRIMIDQFNNKWFLTGFSNESVRDALLGDMNANERAASYNGAVMYNEPDYTKFPGHVVHNFYTQDLPRSSYFEAVVNPAGTIYLTTTDNVLQYTPNGWVEIAPNGEATAATGSMLSALQSSGRVGELAIVDANTFWMIGKDVMRVTNGKVERWNKGDNDLGGQMNGLALDAKGNIWFGNNKGLCQFDGKTFSCMNKKDGLPDMRINEVFIDKEGLIWIGLYSGAAAYNGTTWTEYNKKEGGLEGTWCQSIIQRKNGDICIGTGKGVGITKDKVAFEMITAPKELVAYWQVTALAEDEAGNLFIGTKGDGLFLLKANGEWEKFDTENSGLPHNQINSIVCTTDGVWIVSQKEERPTVTTTVPTASTTTPTPEADIRTNIYKFDPSSAITFFKVK